MGPFIKECPTSSIMERPGRYSMSQREHWVSLSTSKSGQRTYNTSECTFTWQAITSSNYPCYPILIAVVLIRNRIIQKRINVRIEHVQPSRCREDFLRRVKENEARKRLAKERGEKVLYVLPLYYGINLASFPLLRSLKVP